MVRCFLCVFFHRRKQAREMAISNTRDKKNPKPKGEGLFLEVDTVGTEVVWDEVSRYVPKDGCAGTGVLSVEEGEAVFFVVAGGGLVVLPSVGVFTFADLSALIELDAGGDADRSAALFSEDL